MSQTVCAIVVTYNQRERLRACLDSLLAQTRPLDRILVIDNASSDGTRSMLDIQYPNVTKMSLIEYRGGAGGMVAGMRWGHCNKFDWMWTFDDGITVKRDCLETMLAAGADADLIQADSGPETCDFRGALIGKQVTETVGLPDERYFGAGYDQAYGYVASRKTRSVRLNYDGIIRIPLEEPAKNRAGFYLAIRNLFLNRDHLSQAGLPPRSFSFFFRALGAILNQLGEAAMAPAHSAENARAVIDGLRDGLHKRFDRLPRA